MATRLLTYLNKKHDFSFPPPIDAICEIMQESASEEKSFENVDNDGRTTDACLYYQLAYEPSTEVSYYQRIIGPLSLTCVLRIF